MEKKKIKSKKMEEKKKKQCYRLWEAIQILSDEVDSSHHDSHLQSNERGIIRDLAKDLHTARDENKFGRVGWSSV
jgi:hypothetical protein